jgi:hypothetical protein
MNAKRDASPHRDERRKEQQLVGKRIEEATCVGDAVPAPCEIAVDVIGDGSQHIKSERREADAGRREEWQHRDERGSCYTSNRYGVRKIH